MAITLEAIRAAGGIVHSDGNIFFRDISMLQGLAGAAPAAVAPQGVVAWMTPEGDRVVTAETMDGARKDGGASLSSLRPYTVALVRAALEAPPAVAPQGEYPHEQMDAMALARYKVVPSHASMLWSHAVVAGDGAQQLYVGREVECQNMARKFAGAFLDGAFAFHSMAAAPTAQAAPALEAPAAPAGEGSFPSGFDVRRTLQLIHDTFKKDLDAGYRTKDKEFAVSMAAPALAAAPQAPAAPSVNERAAYIEFLTGKFPRSYGKEEAGRWWDNDHVSALAWQAARAVAAAPAELAVDAPAPASERMTWEGLPFSDALTAAPHAPAAPAVDALDAARLDWLEQQAKQSPTGISFDYVLHAEDGQVLEKGWRFMRRHFLGERKSNLRAAIDAAQAAAKGASDE